MSAISGHEDTVGLQRKRGLSRRNQDRLTIVLFLLPAFIFIFTFQIYPMIRSVYYSLYEWSGFGPLTDYVGLANFERLFTGREFWDAVWHTALIMIWSLALQLPLALLLALLVERDLPGRGFFRSIFFMPYVLSEVIIGQVWIKMFKPDPQFGFINAVLEWFGNLPVIPQIETQAWLADPKQALACAFVALTWQFFGLHMLLYIAGLQNVPRELEEAARIDGANELQTIWNITLPLLGNAIRTSVYLSLLGSVQVFGVIWVMARGGPIGATETMSTYMYRSAFLKFSLGYGSAVAVVILVISLILSTVYQRVVGQHDYIGGI
ncbi:MAG: sugar ABC transporter permease [Anaerolineae bacterium]|nr:sugar ABC transporter permease [Anaerolineae bacterium]